MKMKVNNLNKMIVDFEAIFDIALNASNIANIFYDIKIVMANKGFREGDIFRVRQKKYYKNGFGSLDSKTTLFNFEMTEKTGDTQVITYLGYNILNDEKMKMKINNLDKMIIDYEEIFDAAIDATGIPWIVDDIDLVMANKGVGDTFYVEQKKYYKNYFNSFNSKTILFNFALTEKTGGQQVVNYLGYN